jgi:hypothetical protein
MAVPEKDVHVEAIEVRRTSRRRIPIGMVVESSVEFLWFSPCRYSRRIRLR